MFFLKLLASGILLFIFWMQILMFYFGNLFEVKKTSPDDFYSGIVSLIMMVPVSLILVAVSLFILSRIPGIPYKYSFGGVLGLLVGLNLVLFLPSFLMSETGIISERRWVQMDDVAFAKLIQKAAPLKYNGEKIDESYLGTTQALEQISLKEGDVVKHFAVSVGRGFFFACDMSTSGCNKGEFLIAPSVKALLFRKVDEVEVEGTIAVMRDGVEVTEERHETFKLKVQEGPTNKPLLRIIGYEYFAHKVGPHYIGIKLTIENTQYHGEKYFFVRLDKALDGKEYKINQSYRDYLQALEEYRSVSALALQNLDKKKILSSMYYHENSVNRRLVSYSNN